MQMDFEQIRKTNDELAERAQDLQNISIAQNMFIQEELAIRQKKIQEK